MNRSILSEQINKDQINTLKNDRNAFMNFLQIQDDGAIIYILEKLGKLENGHSKQPLLNLLNKKNNKIRILAIKNLAKMRDISLLNTFIDYAKQDESTDVRRESVSAIGRLRNKKAIPILIEFLSDQDPKVIMQGIRGLLAFSKTGQIKKELASLLNHPNELIKELIEKEINGTSSSSKQKKKQDEFPSFLKDTVVQGNTSETLKYVPNESIHLTFTSPPYYNARDYSIYQSYSVYLKFLEEAFREVHRVTKEGRFFILNTSPIIIPRMSRAHASKRYPIPYDIHPLLVKMGWEFIDDIVWIKPEASVKNRNAGFLQHRKPLGYKPNAISEMLMVYRKKTDKLIDWNMRQYSGDKIKKSRVVGKYETTNVWYIDPTFDKTHSAVFPLELCNRIIRYYSFIGDLVLDPFAGSGTLGRAAAHLGRHFFLTEKGIKYVTRMKDTLIKENDLFRNKGAQVNFVTIKDFIALAKRNI